MQLKSLLIMIIFIPYFYKLSTNINLHIVLQLLFPNSIEYKR